MKREAITLTKAGGHTPCIPLTPFFLLLMLAGVIVISARAADDVSAGFLWDHHKLTLEGGDGTEAAGPFYYSQHTEAEDIWAIPPFCSSIHDPLTDRDEFDFLYPFMTRTRYGHERRWQFFEVISTSSGDETDENNTRR